MTQEEKQLLLKDLYARLPYGIFVKEGDVNDRVIYTYDYHPHIETCKPYLRPMSSMTEDEEKELSYIAGLHRSEYGFVNHIDGYPGNSIFTEVVVARAADFFNAHHFDYRGLIEKGLAIAVTEENNPCVQDQTHV